MTTARDICILALKDAGVIGKGNTAAPEDIADTFTTLNQMLADWNRQRWLVTQLQDLSFNSTGAQTYSIGPGQNFNISERPGRLQYAFVRQTNVGAQQPDYGLDVLDSYEDYAKIVLKSMGPFPYAVYYDQGWPNGTLYFWPVPQAGIYQMHILVQSVLSSIASLNSTINLSPEYDAAIRYNLAAALLITYPVPPKPKLEQVARARLDTIRAANFQPARLTMPGNLARRRGIYNIYADTQR